MAKRTQAQLIGARGQRLVAHIVETSAVWVARDQSEDYGVDLEVELAQPEVSGLIMKLQIKSSVKSKFTSGGVKVRLPKALLRYADSLRVPLIFVYVDLVAGRAWYLWLQDWLLRSRRSGVRLQDLPKTITTTIPLSSDLSTGLRHDLIEVASRRTKTQLFNSIADAISTASAIYQRDIMHSLLQLLAKVDTLSENFPVNLIIDEVLALGPRIWATVEGHQASQSLFAVCRILGDRIGKEQLAAIVTRGESYSRTGINALGIIYDEHPEHVASLGLPEFFEQSGHDDIAFYCALRERYLDKKGFELIGEEFIFEYAEIRLDMSVIDRPLDRWANRGDSMLLDYVSVVSATSRA